MATSNWQSRQPKGFNRSVSNAPKALPLWTDLFHFFITAKRQFWVLKPLLKPYCYFDGNLPKMWYLLKNVFFKYFWYLLVGSFHYYLLYHFLVRKVIYASYIWHKVFKSGISKFFKDCLRQNLLSPLLNNLSCISLPENFDVFITGKTRSLKISMFSLIFIGISEFRYVCLISF